MVGLDVWSVPVPGNIRRVLPARQGRDGWQTGRLHGPQVHSSQLRQDLLEPAVESLEGGLGPGGGHRTT